MGRSAEGLARRCEYDRRRAKAKNKAYYHKNKAREAKRCKEYHQSTRDLRLLIKSNWRDKNRDRENKKSVNRRREKNHEYRLRDKARRETGIDRAYRKMWQEKNIDRERERQRRWVRDNPARMRARKAKRRAAKIRATPFWVDLDAIQKIYDEAIRVSLETGIPHEVDHIYPLLGKNMCGLHVPSNLRVITQKENRAKGNRLSGEQSAIVRVHHHETEGTIADL